MQNENSSCISFLHQQILVRKGVGFLAHASNTPVIPVICYRKSLDEIRLRFFNEIWPDKNEKRNTFAHVLMEKLYCLAAQFIRYYPGQWEGWLYLHKVANITNPITASYDPEPLHYSDELIFNTSLFGLFKREAAYYIFNKANYMSYPLDERIYLLLKKSIHEPINKNIIDVNLLIELYKERALITA